MPRLLTALVIWAIALGVNALNAWMGGVPVVGRLLVLGSAALVLIAHVVLVSRLNAWRGALTLGVVAGAVAVPALRAMPIGEQLTLQALPTTLGLTFIVAAVGFVWCTWQALGRRGSQDERSAVGLSSVERRA